MKNPAAKELFDDAISKALERLRPSLDWIDAAMTLADSYDYEMPEWALAVQEISLGDEHESKDESESGKEPPSTRQVELLSHHEFPVNADHDIQLLFALEHRGGTGSTNEVFSTYTELAGSRASLTKRQVRRQMIKLEQTDRVVKEEPGPTYHRNYWRSPSVPAREATQTERPVTFATSGGLPERILQEFHKQGTVAEPGPMERKFREDGVELSKYSVGIAMSRMVGDGRLWRYKYPDSKVNKYGPVEWAEEGDDPDRGFKWEHLSCSS